MPRFRLIAGSCLALLLVAATAHTQPACIITTVAGGGVAPQGEDGPALEIELRAPSDMRRGPDGLVYFADAGNHRIRRITADGRIETVVGTGEPLASGDGGPGLAATVGDILAFQVSPGGSLVWLEADPRRFHYQLRRLRPDGQVESIAGGRAWDWSGDGGPATGAGIFGSSDIALGPAGEIYIASERLNRIRRIVPEGTIETIAGSSDPRLDPPFGPPSSGDGRPAIEAVLSAPTEIAAAPDGALYLLEALGTQVRRIAPNGRIDTYLRFVSDGFAEVPDGTLREQRPYVSIRVQHIGVDQQGRLYFLDTSGLRRIGLDDRFETVSGNRLPFFLDADEATFYTFGEQISRLSFDGELTTLAGVPLERHNAGDGGAAGEAILGSRPEPGPNPMAASPQGELFLYDYAVRRIRVIRNGRIANYAGNGDVDNPIEGAVAAESPLNLVEALAAGADGSLYFGDSRNILWRVSPEGDIERVAGQRGSQCSRTSNRDRTCGDGRAASMATLGDVRSIAADENGAIYVLHEQRDLSGQLNAVARRIGPNGVIESLPIPWSSTQQPHAITLDAEGRLVLLRQSEPRLLREGDDGAIRPFLEQTPIPLADRLAADNDGNLYLAGGSRVYRIAADGTLSDVVPVSLDPNTHGGDGGPAEGVTLGSVSSLATDESGNLYIADSLARRIRRIEKPSECTTPEAPRLATSARNAASGFDLAAPGAIVSLYGTRLGPPQPSVAVPDTDGRYPSRLADIRVLLDGAPLPLLFVSPGQINAVLPNGLLDDRTRPVERPTLRRMALVQVERDGVLSSPELVFLASAAPGLFRQSNGFAAALNQDGTVNDAANPAATGSILILFGTGGGSTDPPGEDDAITGGPLQRLVSPVSLTLGGQPAEIVYAGAAPGLVSGVVQVNARISPDQQQLGAVSAVLTIDGVSSQSASVAITTR